MKHEENVDLKRVSRIAKIHTVSKTIQINKGQVIGIKTWGRIDYLCNILGYRLVKSGIVIGDRFDNASDVKKHNREIKKEAKANKANSNMAKKKKK